jgi:hypothetical protein
MSMHPQPIGPVLEDTARVARAALPQEQLTFECAMCSEPYTMMRTSRSYSKCTDAPPSRRGSWRWLP